MIDILIQHHKLFLSGLLVTLKLIGLIVLIGIPGGVILGVIGSRYSKTVEKAVDGLKMVTKVIPIIVLLFWLHYPLQAIIGVVIDPFWTAIFALGFVNVVSVAHIVQVELKLIPGSYSEAGSVLGMSKTKVIRYIELPILLRRILPSISLVQATMLEYTLFASLISVQEIFRVAQTVNSMVYEPVAIYSLLVIFFILILTPLHLFVSFFNKKHKISYD